MYLQLPVILIINCKGQAASIGALIKGFRDHDPSLKLAGVVLNRVNTIRHQNLLKAVLNDIEVKMLGSLPNDPNLYLESKRSQSPLFLFWNNSILLSSSCFVRLAEFLVE